MATMANASVLAQRCPHRKNWGVLRSFVQKRSIAVYWQAETAHLYAIGGVGRKRDRDIFEEDMTELGVHE